MRRNQLGGVVLMTLALTVGALFMCGSDTWAGKGKGGGNPYLIIDLGTLGGIDSYASDINDNGQIAGAAETGEDYLDPAGNGYRIRHAVRWDPDGTVDLGLLGGPYSEAQAINAIGQVAGMSTTGEFYLEPNGMNMRFVRHAFRWEDLNGNGQSDPGEMVDLGTLGGWNSEAEDLNDAGQVVGGADTEELNPEGYPFSHAFVWLPADAYGLAAGMHDLGTLPGGTSSWAYSVNSQGQVVGSGNIATGEWHAFLWLPSAAYGLAAGMHDLGTLGGLHSEATVITDEGDIYGTALTGQGGRWADSYYAGHLTRWEPDGQGGFTVTDLGTLKGKKGAKPYGAAGVGAAVQVVGASWDLQLTTAGGGVGGAYFTPTDPDPFRWQAGKMASIPGGGSGFSELFSAVGINLHGEIVGVGTTDGFDRRGYLAIPVP